MDWKMYFVLMTVDNIYRIPEASLFPIRGEGKIFGDMNDGLNGEKENDNSRKKLHSGVAVQRAGKQAESTGKENPGEIETIVATGGRNEHLEEILRHSNDPLSSSKQKQESSVEDSRQVEEFFGSGNERFQTEKMQGNLTSGNLTRNSGPPRPLLSGSIVQTTETETDGKRSRKKKNGTAAMRNNQTQEAKNSNTEQPSEITKEQRTAAVTMDNKEERFGSRQKGVEAENGTAEQSAQSKEVEKSGEGLKSTELVNNTTKAESIEKERSGEIVSPKGSHWAPRQELKNTKLNDIHDLGKTSTKNTQGTTTTEMEGEHGLHFGSGGGDMNEKKSDKNSDLKQETENSEQTGIKLDGKLRSGERASDDEESQDENNEEEEERGGDDLDSNHKEGSSERLPGEHERLDKVHVETTDTEEVGRENEVEEDDKDDEDDEDRDEKKLEEFLGLVARKSEKTKEETKGSDRDEYGNPSGNIGEDWEIQGLRERRIKDMKNAGKDGHRLDTKAEGGDNEMAVPDTPDREYNDRTRTKDRERTIMAHLENFVKHDNWTTQECQGRQTKIITHLEDFMKDEDCSTQETHDRQRNILTHLEDFMKKDDNCSTQENQDRQKQIISHLEDFMEDDNCSTQETQDRQRNILTHLEDFMKKDDNCSTQETQDRQKQIMTHLEDFMKGDNCTTRENHDKQREIMSNIEDFEDFENTGGKNNTTYSSLPKRGRGRATYNPIKLLTDVHKMEQELLQAQREANSELDDVQSELGRKLSGLEINLGMVIQLANTMDQKIGNAVENAMEMTDEASVRAKNKLAQVREAALAVEVIERKVGADRTVNASRVLLSRLPENPNFNSNKLYRQLLATNALITKLEGAKIMAESRAERSYEGEEKMVKTIENEAEMIRKELARAEVELSENTAKELEEEREAKEKIREAQKKNAETYQRASQALTKVENYLAKLEKDEAKLSKY